MSKNYTVKTIDELVGLIKREIKNNQKLIEENISTKSYHDISRISDEINTYNYILYVIENGRNT